jgi:hypothetical protein
MGWKEMKDKDHRKNKIKHSFQKNKIIQSFPLYNSPPTETFRVAKNENY